MKTASESREARIPAAAGADPLTILCGVDGSEAACRAVEVAADLGRRCNARLAFVSVASEAPLSEEVRSYLVAEGLKGQAQPLLRKDAEACLRIAIGIAREAGIQDVERLVVIDGSAQGIVATANKLGASIIVLGHHGRHAVKNLLFGSTVRKVLDQASQSVLLVK